jgi:hypothetical protein
VLSEGSTDGDGSTVRRRLLRVLGWLLAWAVVAVPAWAVLFTHSSEEMVVASHDARVHPTFDGRIRLDMGPYLPDLRTSSGGRIGVAVEMRKTTASTTAELAERYAAIAARPGAEERRVTRAVTGLALDAALRAAVIGLVPIGLWLLLGPRRRAELLRRPGRRPLAMSLSGAVVVVLLVAQPWGREHESVTEDVWLPMQDAVPDITVPEELTGWEIQGVASSPAGPAGCC